MNYRSLIGLVFGTAACAAVAAMATLLQRVEVVTIGIAYVEAHAAAILLGTCVRSARLLPQEWDIGIRFCAKPLLEAAVALLGTAISLQFIHSVSPILLCAIVVIVSLSLIMGYVICRMAGLSSQLSTLIAAGNCICGNSAIVAVAPAIRAQTKDVTAAIAFTAIWGIPLVIALPWFASLLSIPATSYGTFAGLTVYSVPQVIAATAPLGVTAMNVAALIKLIRVMLLAPVVLVLSLVFSASGRTSLRSLAPPWFIFVFFVLATARSLGLFPAELISSAQATTTVLTLLAMSALGLSADLRLLFQSGIKMTLATLGSMAVLSALSGLAIKFVP